MGKRANGEGSIYQRKRDGRWVAEIVLESTGTRRRRKQFYGRTQAEAREKRDQARRDQDLGVLMSGPRQTVRQFVERWLTDTARRRVRPSTYRRYEELTRLHAIPMIGRLALYKLSPEHLSQLYSGRLDAGLSPRTVEFLHRTLHCALREAVRWGLIARNPADAVKPPRPKRPPLHPLDHEQAQRFLVAAQAEPLEALYVVAIMIGMRQGELLGLQWADIDWRQGRVHVSHTLQWLKGGRWSLDEPKNRA